MKITYIVFLTLLFAGTKISAQKNDLFEIWKTSATKISYSKNGQVQESQPGKFAKKLKKADQSTIENYYTRYWNSGLDAVRNQNLEQAITELKFCQELQSSNPDRRFSTARMLASIYGELRQLSDMYEQIQIMKATGTSTEQLSQIEELIAAYKERKEHARLSNELEGVWVSSIHDEKRIFPKVILRFTKNKGMFNDHSCAMDNDCEIYKTYYSYNTSLNSSQVLRFKEDSIRIGFVTQKLKIGSAATGEMFIKLGEEVNAQISGALAAKQDVSAGTQIAIRLGGTTFGLLMNLSALEAAKSQNTIHIIDFKLQKDIHKYGLLKGEMKIISTKVCSKDSTQSSEKVYPLSFYKLYPDEDISFIKKQKIIMYEQPVNKTVYENSQLYKERKKRLGKRIACFICMPYGWIVNNIMNRMWKSKFNLKNYALLLQRYENTEPQE